MALYLEDMWRGDTYRVEIQYDLSVDITGYVHTLVLARELDDDADTADNVLVESSTVGSHSLDSIPNARAYLEVPAAQTLIPSGKYFYRLRVTSPSGERVTLCPAPEDYRDKIGVLAGSEQP